MKTLRLSLATIMLFAVVAWPQTRSAGDWLTWGGDAARTGWAKNESALSRDNIGRLELKWKTQLDNPFKVEVLSTLTAPIVIENVRTNQGNRTLAFVVGSQDIVYALDGSSGKVVWRRSFPNQAEPAQKATVNCPNVQNSTPVIDKEAGILYVVTSDGKLRGLSIADGTERMEPADFIPPYARSWSLNLIDGVVYTAVARGCAGTVATITGMNLKDPAHPIVAFATSPTRSAGAWGRGGPVLGPKGLVIQTADGPLNVEKKFWGNSVMQFSLKTLELMDSFTPDNLQFLNQKDLDLGSSSPIAFRYQNWDLVAAAGKEGRIYVLDGNSLGGAEHRTPLFSQRYGNDEFSSGQLRPARGVWGAMATAEDAGGNRWLYVPMWGPLASEAPPFQNRHGIADSGSILGFQLGIENGKPALIPRWMSRSMEVPEPPVVVNGMVLSVSSGEQTQQHPLTPQERTSWVSHATLYAFDATTGKELYSSDQLIDGWSHFGGLAVSGGKVYLVAYPNRVYSFGLKR